jgi:hypothetical protein
MRHHACTVSALLLAGCAADADLVLTDPNLSEDIAWLAVIGVNEAGRETAAGILTRRDPAGVVRIEADSVGGSDELWVIGFSKVTIARAAEEVPDETLQGSQIRLATDFDPPLPSPDYFATASARSGSQGLTRASLPADAELTAPWLSACPELSEPAALVGDTSCVQSFCDLRIEARARCGFEIESQCALGRIAASFDGRGGLDFEESGETLSQCGSVDPREPAIFSFECTRENRELCVFDFYREPASPSLEATQTRLLEVPTTQAGPSLLPVEAYGYSAGLAKLADRVVVTTYGGDFVRGVCDRTEPSQLFFLDEGTLEVIDTATAPPCLGSIVADPTSAGFIGWMTEERTVFLARFDASGRLVERVEGDLSSFPTDSPPFMVGLFAGGTPPRAHLAARDLAIDPVPGQFLTFALSPLAFLDPLSTRGAAPSAVGFGDSGELAVLDLVDERVRSLDYSSGELRTEFKVNLCGPQSPNPTNFVYHPTLGRYAVTTNDLLAEVHLVSGRELLCESMDLFEWPAAGYAAVPWGEDSLLVGLWSDSEQKSTLAMLNGREARFLPGALDLGDLGPPGPMAVSGEQIYVLFPRSSVVARVRPL